MIQIFKGFKSTLPRPAPQDLPIFAGRGGERLVFLRGGAALFPLGGAGWGGAHIPAVDHRSVQAKMLEGTFSISKAAVMQ